MRRVRVLVTGAFYVLASSLSGCAEGGEVEEPLTTIDSGVSAGGGIPGSTGGVAGLAAGGATGAPAGLAGTATLAGTGTATLAGTGTATLAGTGTATLAGTGTATLAGTGATGAPGAVRPGGTGATGTVSGVGGTFAGGIFGAAGGGVSGAAAGAGGGTGAGGTAGGGTAPVGTGAPGEPKIPAVNGACPAFRNGTVMVAGHRGVSLQANTGNKMGSLLFYWHGTGSSASEVNGGFIGGLPSSVRSEVLSGGGIIASFDGNSSSQAEGDCSGTGAHNMADFKAADQIVACAVKDFGIDPRRIYATGCSAGGLQSGCMAQVRSSYMAAVAPNSGGVVFPQRWQDAGKPAVFTMHGGSSDWVIVTFSETSATFDMSSKQHGSFVVNCDHGGGHCAAPDALKVAAWTFMKAHPYGAESPWKSGIPAGVPSYCKIY